jgi:cyclic pyranopterin monophosphate synthase
MDELSHVDPAGKARMVDIAGKKDQTRTAKASGSIILDSKTIDLIKQNNIKKGNVLDLAQFAGIMGAKQTPNLIPLCHQLNISKIDVSLKLTGSGIEVFSEVKCVGKTGVEMEALTSVSIALLTVYDMCKAVDKKMLITEIKLLEKTKEDLE